MNISTPILTRSTTQETTKHFLLRVSSMLRWPRATHWMLVWISCLRKRQTWCWTPLTSWARTPCLPPSQRKSAMNLFRGYFKNVNKKHWSSRRLFNISNFNISTLKVFTTENSKTHRLMNKLIRVKRCNLQKNKSSEKWDITSFLKIKIKLLLQIIWR